MAHFYRDQEVSNTTISKDDLAELKRVFETQEVVGH